MTNLTIQRGLYNEERWPMQTATWKAELQHDSSRSQTSLWNNQEGMSRLPRLTGQKAKTKHATYWIEQTLNKKFHISVGRSHATDQAHISVGLNIALRYRVRHAWHYRVQLNSTGAGAWYASRKLPGDMKVIMIVFLVNLDTLNSSYLLCSCIPYDTDKAD